MIFLISGLQYEGRDLKIDLSEPRTGEARSERPRAVRTPSENSVFVGNLGNWTHHYIINYAVEDKIREYLTFGSSENHRLIRLSQPSTLFSPDFGVTEASILDMCEGVLGQGTALKVRIATDRETGE